MTSAMESRSRTGESHATARRAKEETIASLYARYMHAGGDHRGLSMLQADGRRRLSQLREAGFDLGIGDDAQSHARVSAIYAHARARSMLRSIVGYSVMRVRNSSSVATTSRDREDYLAHPATGERLRNDDARAVERLGARGGVRVQVVISDGLNANAINEQVRAVLPALSRLLQDAGCHAAETVIAVRNGRVRVGYEIGGFVHADVIVHLIGERPGTGLNTLSAYLTFGRDQAGHTRWSRDLDHAATTAICGIHPKGKPPQIAAAEIARTVARILDQNRSGVALRG